LASTTQQRSQSQPISGRFVWCSSLRGCLFCCTTLAQSSRVATLAPFNPNKVFASLIHYLKGGNRHSVFLLACGSLRLIGVSHFLYIYRPATSPISLSKQVALPYSFRSLPLRPTLMLRVGPAPAFAPFTSHRSLGSAPPRYCHARCGSLSVGSRPSCFGPSCLCRSLRSHRNAPRDYHRRYCRVCFVLSVDYRPSYFGSDNRLRSLHAHRIALLALFPLAGWLLTHPSFRQPPDLLHSLTLPFLCSCSLTQSLCSLMLRSSTPSFTSFTQPSYFMANASLCSSGVCRQSPNHQTFALSPSSPTQQLPVSDASEQKVRHPCWGQ